MRPLLLALALTACKAPPTPATPSPEPSTVLHILAINDFHGALYEVPDRHHEGKVLGGLPFLAGAIESLRAEHPDALLLDGGDVYQGTWPVNQSHGMGAVQSMNLLGVDAAAVGNHEFDYGGAGGGHPLRGALERGAKAAAWPWLTANIEELQEDGSWIPWHPEGIAPWTVLESGGIRLGVIGLSTTETPQTTKGANVVDLRFLDVVDTVRRVLPEVEAEGVDAIAIVGHLAGSCPTEGDAPCTPTGEIKRLVEELPPGAVDLIVSGHSHTAIAERLGDTLVVQNYAKGQAVGHVELVFTEGRFDIDASVVHDPWVLSHDPADPGCDPGDYDLTPQAIGARTVTPSKQALDLVKGLEGESGNLCAEVGCSAALMTRSRGGESAVGNLAADAMKDAFPDADLALTNAGGLRANLPEGTLRREDLQAVMPFDNRVVMLEMRGEDLERMLTIGTSGGHGLLQIAGGTIHIDPERTQGQDLDGDGQVAEWERDRLCAATIGGKPLDPSATYKVVINDFMLGGGDHMGPAVTNAAVLEEGPLLREQLYSWFEEYEGCVGADGPVVDPDAPRIRQGPCAP